jgi:hypothetical protein
MTFQIRPIVLAATLVAGSYPVLAAVDYVDIRNNGIHINDGRVVVEPVNNRYGNVTTPQTSYHVEMKAGCKGLNQELKDTFVAFGNAGMNGSIVEANPGMATVPVSNRGNKEIGYTEAELVVPIAQIDGALDPVKACNTWLDQRLAQGASLMQVWTKDQTLIKPVTLSAVASCGGNSNSRDYRTATMNHQLTIVCKAGSVGGSVGGIQAQQPKPPQAPGEIAKIMEVVAVELKVLTPQVVGNCPAKVKFQVEATTDAPGKVNYQVRFPANANTPEQAYGGQINFNAAGKRVTPTIEFNAVSGYPVGVAVVEIVNPGNKKAYADFKVQCVNAPSPGSIQFAPKPGGNGVNKFQPNTPNPKPGLNIEAVPSQPKLPGSIQAKPLDPTPGPARAVQSN